MKTARMASRSLVLILTFALLAGSRTCSAVSVECSGCNVVAYTIHSRLSREDIDLHTPETLKASMEATCQSSGCGKKAGRVRGLMQGGRDGLRLDSRAFRRTKREYESTSVNSHLTRPIQLAHINNTKTNSVCASNGGTRRKNGCTDQSGRFARLAGHPAAAVRVRLS